MNKDTKLIEVFEDENINKILAAVSEKTNITTLGELENVSLRELEDYRNIGIKQFSALRYLKKHVGIYSRFDEIYFKPKYEYTSHLFKNEGDKLVKATLVENGIYSYYDLSVEALKKLSKSKSVSEPIFNRMIEMKKILIEETFEFFQGHTKICCIEKDYYRLKDDFKQISDLKKEKSSAKIKKLI